MRDSEVASKIRGIAEALDRNLNGRSITEAEFWADTLDRWAEELVEAAQSGRQHSKVSRANRPGCRPNLVLEVMKSASRRDRFAGRDP